MGFTVSDALQCPGLREFRLVAGNSGLNRVIGSTEFLDAEYDDEVMGNTGRKCFFSKNAFVLTSLMSIKNDESKILPLVKRLVEENVSALAIEEVYFTSLPAEVISYADEQGFPILMFAYDVANTDEIIIEIHEAMLNNDSLYTLEQKIAELMNPNISRATAFAVASELVEGAEAPYVVYFFQKEYTKEIRTIYKLLIEGAEEDGYYILPYKTGLFMIKPVEQHQKERLEKNLDMLLIQNGIDRTKLHIGCSKIFFLWKYLDYALKEAMYAAQYAEMFAQGYAEFTEIGIYRILLPYKNDYWLLEFCKSLLDQLQNYDREYETELFDTVQTYIEHNCNVNEVADILHIHKNTVRYRLGKAKELLMGEQESEKHFEEQMYLAFEWKKLMSDS